VLHSTEQACLYQHHCTVLSEANGAMSAMFVCRSLSESFRVAAMLRVLHRERSSWAPHAFLKRDSLLLYAVVRAYLCASCCRS
jgi:hypothetical protein